MARLASLIMKVDAPAFALALSRTCSINLQLLGGIWILQTFPAIVVGLYTRWFHRWALVIGWAAAMVYGTVVAYNTPAPGATGSHFGASTANVPGLNHTVYIAVTPLIINLVVATVLTAVFRMMRLPLGTDETQPANYLAGDDGSAVEHVPVAAAAAGTRAPMAMAA